ncbi:API5-domain-containing protein [Rhizophagus irregularis]|uniref:API5-domain-containing protein n=2 Tax=Rhizophagus irregularis TaxID=588596 RepID=A0A2I1GLK9_9GLOM|nr:hypothetical protein GLOIN_2v1685373 [Rhizophagus irregularis DAOM 181602=DAOM 197198]PKC18047.1 API5-domain-containing protein [Rhizophagus irregularis]PKC71950.1 API5-domain-containing protein [Rhizophagus irregularis]PKY15441.1 API5-domain-containing protein [Rhizophagus irregularis]PKY47520.1 API5-domain-containing protein [Rhizophagus irregularis]POG63542.1 hypothetical protein GLOIN_2v1685373 [Rhizophagus irregularis DAOM 181602=DAOM 197198]|eukprot:XP_025170408.1 hypothetical protein GLOIN_2v1685373 [Rhizophagus irregularis DAOM 181602=DAOM 197198]
MTEVDVEQIYKAYEEINNASDNTPEIKRSYEILIAGAHGSSNCKRLAAQFIPRFFGKFPEYYETALDALFDLCEDTDINVRLTVIKYMPNVVKEFDKFAVRIADALVQLLENGNQNLLYMDHGSNYIQDFSYKRYFNRNCTGNCCS